ncbi:hypothetical protein DEIGR_400040 [Deinococcus grandis]|uniref:Uncharacterized protein n=1 Tax=Deinococcus grandis TaxID=57498 RepID=A0A117DPS3_9DEIO|nr:hypothetical protein [Deinococcus grandis]GAQ23907.1 hypothetical protein DEIGR_400040 [Deinococcus grandis]
MKNIKFAFGTGTRKTLPFEIGGVTFFSRPLTSREELELADLGDRYDLENENAPISTYLEEQAQVLATLLATRANGQAVDPGWMLDHLGVQNMTAMLAFLRTGERPHETLNLKPWTDEPLTIEGRPFTMRPLTFREQARLAAFPQDGSSRAITEFTAAHLAELLNVRALPSDNPDQDQQAVTANWLLDHLGAAELQQILTLIQNGPNADGAETEDPPSEAAASTPS